MSPTAPQTTWKPATPAEVAALQKRFTGLDNELHYKEGHTIHKDYTGYKAAHETAKAAVTVYKSTAKTLPHAGDSSVKVCGKRFTAQGHRTMAPLAGTACGTSQEHANKRDAFNTKYKPVLDAQGPEVYINHVKPAKEARDLAQKYAKAQQQHNDHS